MLPHRGCRRIGLALFLEFVLDAYGDGEVPVDYASGAGGGGGVRGVVAGEDGVGGDAEDPLRGAVQVHVAAEDGGRGDLVGIEVDG
jgi:hypothetical protein